MEQENALQKEIKKPNWKIKIILIAIAAVSFFLLAVLAKNPENYHIALQDLTEKQNVVIKLTGLTAAASTAITVIPGDIGTPIAEELADLSGYLVFVYCVILFEKYLMTVGGWIAFKILIPIACVVAAFWGKRENSKKLCVKLVVFALVIWLVVPFSSQVTRIIQSTHDEVVSIQLEELEESIKIINGETEETDKEESEENGGILKRIFGENEEESESSQEVEESEENSNIFTSIKKAKNKALERLKNILSRMLETIAIMIVTCCIIPLAVLVFLIWIVRTLFGIVINIPIPKGSKLVKKYNEWQADRDE